MDGAVRFAVATFLVATYVAMVLVQGTFAGTAPTWRRLAGTCGLVVLIVAVAALLLLHRQGARPAWELLPMLLVPFVLRAALGGGLGLGRRDLWAFVGGYGFLVVAGGFALGILGSPLVALLRPRGPSAAEVAETVRGGVAFVRALGLGAFGLVLAAGCLAALLVVAGDLGQRLPEPTPLRRTVLYLVLLTHLGGVAAFTALHTVLAPAPTSQTT